mgnify:CR=1 FL=1
MVRISGIDIPAGKRTEIALTYIFGIGRRNVGKLLKLANVNPDKRAKEITQEEAKKIQNFIEKHYKVEGELRQNIRSNIGRLKEIKAYRGLRHMRKLPVRGQRTKTNSRTVRGNVRKTVGSGKRKAELK